jgi:hypothetical protein
MKRLFLSLLLFPHFFTSAQTYNGSGGLIQNNGVETYFNLNVSGLSPATIDSLHGLEEVTINILHPKVEELYIFLVSPSGTTVELTEGASCSGINYSVTCFNSNSNLAITSTVAPYNGTFRPIGYLGRFNTGQTGNGNWKLIVKDYLAFLNSGSLVSWSLKFSNTPAKPVVFNSSGLPIVVINTNNQLITETNITADLGIIYNGVGQLNHPSDPKNNYNGKAAIHIRGQTTKNFEKKAYSIELRNISGQALNSSILGMPSESDWELIAEYQDKTLMRIPLSYQLARQMGHYAARTKNVEVIVDGEYRGIYALVEKIKRNVERVNIRKLSLSDNALPFVSGGYLLKIDRTDSPGWNSLLPGNSPSGSHFFYQYCEPKDSLITTQQSNYIKTYMNDFETLMDSPNYKDPVNGYAKYVDVSSAVDYLIANEISKNVDGYRLSSYLYKKDIAQGGKLFFGPVWDYDLAWHNCNYANTTDPTGWEYLSQDSAHPSPMWWTKFMQDSNFVNKLYCRWQTLRQGVLSNNSIYQYIDSTTAALNEAQKRNFKQWPIIGTFIYPNPQYQLNASYTTEIADLKTWVNSRFAWMDANINGHCTITGASIGKENEENSISVYPNPFENTTSFKMYLKEESKVSLTIFDALGRTVISFPEATIESGRSEFILDRSHLGSSGLYFYQLKIANTTKSGKIIMQ